MNKDWLDSIRERMEDFEESAPEGLWESIESSLGAPAPRRKVILPWIWRSVAAAAAAAAIVVAGVQVARNGQKSTIDPNNLNQLTHAGSDASNQENQDSHQTIPSSSVNPGILAPSDAPASSRRLASAHIPVAKVSPERQDVAFDDGTSGEVAETVVPESVEDREDAGATVAAGPDRKDEALAGLPMDHEDEDWSGYMSASAEENGDSRDRLGVKVSLGGGTLDSETSSTFDTRQFYHGAPSVQMAPDFSGSGRPFKVAQAPSVTNTTVHKRPVRAEVTLRLPLYRNLGIETGVAYSVLRSTFATTSGTTRTNEYQTLRYVGIPVNLTADVLHGRWMTVYFSGGAMAAKCIGGNVRTTTVNFLSGETLVAPENTSLTVDPWLYSLNAVGGFQFNATPNIGLYVAPGVSYHFDDKSGVQTFYKEHPFDFVLSFGLRYDFK